VFGFMLTFTFSVVLTFWLLALGVVGLAFWLLVGLALWLARSTGHRTALIRWRSVHLHPSAVFVVGLGFGYVTLYGSGHFNRQGFALAFGLLGLGGFGLSLRFALGRLKHGPVSPLTPFASWRQHRVAALGTWLGLGSLVGGSLVGFAPGLWAVLWFDLGNDGAVLISLGFALASGFSLGLIYPETWTTSLACTQLAIRWHTPIRLMRFLDDAREHNVLRTVGPIYQFRHARLQDRLAELNFTPIASTTGDTVSDQSTSPTSSTPPGHPPITGAP
jgi:hypothetical protein